MLLYFFLTPVFKTSAQVPQESWVPEPKNYFTPIVYTLQIICLSESIPVAIIIDGTFLLMCGEFEIQFVLLKKTLQSIRIGENSAAKHESFCFKKLKQCSAYHCLLLEEHKKMKRVFSEFFLLQYLLSIEGLCIELFVINESQSWDKFTLAAIYIVGIIMQSSFTFLSASNLEIAAESLPDDIYQIDWYNSSNNKIPKHVLFMLMRAQKPLRLTGAGLFDVNRNMFLQIMRTGFSISALIRQV
ncbi:odorant receptor 10-like [Tenebrio molitor]|uniref:odorant receptor 10-like n=1 Tax=Tenebrio molitor TaxID=7067 RepID=UPI00362497A6